MSVVQGPWKRNDRLQLAQIVRDLRHVAAKAEAEGKPRFAALWRFQADEAEAWAGTEPSIGVRLYEGLAAGALDWAHRRAA